MHNNSPGTTTAISRRALFGVLASGISSSCLPLSQSAVGAASEPQVARVESRWETQGRIDAGRGIFHPPHAYVAWTDSEARGEADICYQRGYWREFGRLRFERGEYDLL